MNNVSDEILKAIRYAIDKIDIATDRTFSSVIKQVNSDGTYIILGEDGSERKVYSSIPSLNLKVMSRVWVKMPRGRLNDMHICGIIRR